MEKGAKTSEKTSGEKTNKEDNIPSNSQSKPLVPEVASVIIKITQEDANALSSIADYLFSRPMSETEQGVIFMRNLMQRISESA